MDILHPVVIWKKVFQFSTYVLHKEYLKLLVPSQKTGHEPSIEAIEIIDWFELCHMTILLSVKLNFVFHHFGHTFNTQVQAQAQALPQTKTQTQALPLVYPYIGSSVVFFCLLYHHPIIKSILISFTKSMKSRLEPEPNSKLNKDRNEIHVLNSNIWVEY